MSRGSTAIVSVIIPVYMDVDRLQVCLEALASQTLDWGDFEVIVVDNAPDPYEAIRALCATYPFARYSHEPRTGSYAARNHGISVAKAEVLAFTDSDCIPAPNWLEEGLAAWRTRDSQIGFLAGEVQLFGKVPGRLNAVEAYELAVGFHQEYYVRKHQSGATANLFTSRDVLDQVGPFAAHLRSGGDTEWGQRATAKGLPGAYISSAIVRHPARSSLTELNEKSRRLVTGALARAEYSPRAQVYGLFRWALLRPVRSAFLVLGKGLPLRTLPGALGVVLLVAVIQVAEHAESLFTYYRRKQQSVANTDNR